MLASLGISNSTGWALVHLQRLGAGARQSELARVVGVAEPSLVRTIQQLERGGLIVREQDQADRRANCLQLTAEGARLARSIDARLGALRAELTQGVTDKELGVAVRALDRIDAAIADKRAGL
ncbi:MarR family transcriptional regulator [Novosphingobium sp. Rr 2-17]|nr:MarR family transcriptional regulator [Novosphingobium sp. Rr 2-17]